ncbi:hypothetical protein M2427_004414 [Bradyrhizobium sp. BR13661]|jgi:hypothetical protein|nr:hypothetical protein [Bradyrhizobium sp. BR13661]
MRTLAPVLTIFSVLSLGMPCSAGQLGTTEGYSPSESSQRAGEHQPEATDQTRNATYRPQRMMDQRDWDHRKAGREWQLRDDKNPSH